MDDAPPLITCRHCGSALPAEANFCMVCGRAVKPGVAVPPSSAVVEPRFSMGVLSAGVGKFLFEPTYRRGPLFYLVVLIGYRIIVFLYYTVISSLVPSSIEELTTFMGSMFLVGFVGDVVGFFVDLLIVAAAVRGLQGQTNSFVADVGVLARRMGSLLPMLLIVLVPPWGLTGFMLLYWLPAMAPLPEYVLLNLIGSLSLVVSVYSLVVTFGFFLYQPVILFEDVGPLECLRRSYSRMGGYRIPVFVLIILVAILLGFVGDLIDPFDFLTMAFRRWIFALFSAITYQWITTHPPRGVSPPADKTTESI